MKKLLIALIFIVSVSFFVRAADDTDDVQCPEGRIYNATVESCVPCPPGTYAPYSENKVCKPCPEGTIAPKQALESAMSVVQDPMKLVTDSLVICVEEVHTLWLAKLSALSAPKGL